MLKKIIVGLLLTSSLFAETELWKFFKYSTAYASFSLNAPRHQDDRFAIVGGLSTGNLVFEREERELKPDFQKSFGLRKIGRFKYEPKRGVKNAGNGGTWYDGSEQSANENATFGPVKGWEFLLKFSEGRQWGDDYINQEYWLRYVGEWFMVKGGYTELGLEDVQYAQGDLRVKKSIGGFNVSVGVKHRQHPVYGYDAAILDTTWYKGQWWNFAEDAFGVDDNRWFDPSMMDEDGNFIKQELYELDPITGELVPVEGAGPFWNEGGEYWGHDWLWRDEIGNIFAYTDREFFLYHFPGMLEDYITGVKSDLGYMRETSIVVGGDFYHYADNWWVHAWGNWLPYHYGHDKYSYHNAHDYKQHKDDKKPPHLFEFSEPGWKAWNDYDYGAIFGVKLKDNLGVFAEGRYLYYWDKPAYDLKFGVNYQFIGF
jgi:hypothetical protein|tara:strand:+ start:186 stop:1466 length:1281 start_codon:yes stop_codon:yes gene_type:complete